VGVFVGVVGEKSAGNVGAVDLEADGGVEDVFWCGPAHVVQHDWDGDGFPVEWWGERGEDGHALGEEQGEADAAEAVVDGYVGVVLQQEGMACLGEGGPGDGDVA